MGRFQSISGNLSRVKVVLAALGILILIGVALIGCQSQSPATSTPITTTPPPTSSTPPATTTTIPPPPPASVTPTTPTPPPAPTTNPPAQNVTAPPPVVTPPPLPTFVSFSSNLAGQALQGAALAKVTATFHFDTTVPPGFYSISLLAGTDNFGAQQVEWYRANNQVSLEWAVLGGRPAFYRLLNNDPITDIFQTQISYKQFASLTAVPRTTPTDLESGIVNLINRERTSRGLSLLVWDNNLYSQALQRLTAIGQEGQIIPPSSNQTYLETDYVTTPGVNDDAQTVFMAWTIDQNYFNVVHNPTITTIAIRTDTYDNKKFYVVGLYK